MRSDWGIAGLFNRERVCSEGESETGETREGSSCDFVAVVALWPGELAAGGGDDGGRGQKSGESRGRLQRR